MPQRSKTSSPGSAAPPVPDPHFFELRRDEAETGPAGAIREVPGE